MKFLDDLNEVWKPKYISTKRADDIRLAQREEREREGLVPEEDWYRERDELSHFSTDYIVIGPLSDDFQVATGECKIALHVYTLYVKLNSFCT